jgi:hypothetical protein
MKAKNVVVSWIAWAKMEWLKDKCVVYFVQSQVQILPEI